MPNSVRFQRVLKAPPERVYRAFLDAEAMTKWLPPHGFTAKSLSQNPCGTMRDPRAGEV